MLAFCHMLVENLLKGPANYWSVLQHLLVHEVESLGKLFESWNIKTLFQIYISQFATGNEVKLSIYP